MEYTEDWECERSYIKPNKLQEVKLQTKLDNITIEYSEKLQNFTQES